MSRLVVVSNRVAPIEPGKAPSGGLAVGVLDALRQSGGIWLGWNGDVSNEEVPPGKNETHDNITYHTFALNKRDYDQYYRGFANATLWPVFHYRVDLSRYSREEYDGYRRVNAAMAERLKPLLKPDDIIWVHDYHLIPFAEACQMIGIRNRIGFFLHTPFPAPEILTAIPPHNELLKTLCFYDVVGFQTETDKLAFQDYITREVRGVLESDGSLTAYGHNFRAEVYPIGTVPDDIIKQAESYRARRNFISRSIEGVPYKTIVSVDRLDYSKGLVERFCAYEKLLERFPEHRKRVQFVQIAPTSRSDVKTYQHIRQQLESQAGHINGRFSELDWTPIRYLNKSYDRRTVMGLFRSADIGLVTPLRDGMNLVAKEYVAAQDPEDPGVLVLSRFAGAARELNSALIVNPYDVVGMAEALDRAISMPLQERKDRYEDMMRIIRKNDLASWRDKFLKDLRAVKARPVANLRAVGATGA
ncbi:MULTISPECIES: alpha,alpha-trehalose-phosphate synthase (UDP-forming) [Pseudomonas]|uniref:Trehalose-6-phosphate synthase n=2 Tax=Pseudomonas TaxID=286 RepID=A0A2X2CZ08_PSELU|nr:MULTISPECIES: alpha,alpha-trehalose-phosphate synthase (UDP-forming) [Pseudomonas]AYN93206.1 alpha,alpha-trehalose-phosphate synthase (UDP-forming) [Pseudomonas sp. LTJR-52]ENA35207.1 alpha,alpha-trehalose-phosphate synthase (UDP-forming) [Pseudomonas sp. HPB0071]MBA1248850.1 alpha,alpha-trehalose-phosphate synthase (UDP-forming) [Pseudomonas zeshuii]MBF8642649.1 alpha,alpha-trehalose-phosphate synthase (UDP-forming) [Pseudomonas zeshuii]MBH3439757.1 alpha,alpha-trehalose-phosphate synthase